MLAQCLQYLAVMGSTLQTQIYKLIQFNVLPQL